MEIVFTTHYVKSVKKLKKHLKRIDNYVRFVLSETKRFNRKELKMELVKLTKEFAIFICKDSILAIPIDNQAKQVLNWYYKNIPANN